jgi:hypothetical protein
MDDGIEAHLQLRAYDLQRTGLSPAAARAEAERRFGDLRAAQRQLHAAARRREGALRHRDWITGIGMDIRFASRRGRPWRLRARICERLPPRCEVATTPDCTTSVSTSVRFARR